MLHRILGNGLPNSGFFRFETDSGVSLDPVFTTGGATFEWISPNGSISTGAVPNPALDQTGVYTVKCNDWSDVTQLEFQSDNLIALDCLSLLTSLTHLFCFNNTISVLDVSALTSLEVLTCHTNTINVLNVAALTSLRGLYCHTNSMDEANVDKILADLVTAGVNNGTVDISGTNAAPSAAGLASKATLEGAPRNWTVTVS